MIYREIDKDQTKHECAQWVGRGLKIELKPRITKNSEKTATAKLCSPETTALLPAYEWSEWVDHTGKAYAWGSHKLEIENWTQWQTRRNPHWILRMLNKMARFPAADSNPALIQYTYASR